jgi:hypothetical protein
MSDEFYRDAHVGITARLMELQMRIDEREGEMTAAFWEAIDPEVRERLAALRGGRELAARETNDLNVLTRSEAMQAAYLEELDGLIATLPSLEASWAEVPDDVAAPSPIGSRGDENFATGHDAVTLFQDLHAMVRDRARDVEMSGEAPSCLVRFKERGCPFALRATTYANGNRQVGEVGMWLVTSVARALPPLVVRHESLVLSVGKALGLKHDVEVGDPSFDGLFIIEGTQEAADLFLTPSVRAQLLSLARFDVPTLEIDSNARHASLRWRFEPATKALDAAIRILTAVRETPPSIRFRRE